MSKLKMITAFGGAQGLSPSPYVVNGDNRSPDLGLFGLRAILTGHFQLVEPLFDGGQSFGQGQNVLNGVTNH